MNMFLILTFIASLICMAILLWRKTIEVGKYAEIQLDPLEEQGMRTFFSENSLCEEDTWDAAKFIELKNRAIELAKEYGHFFVLWLLKVWIKAYYFGKKQKKRLHEKATILSVRVSKITKRIPSPIPPESRILRQVANYKSRLVKIARKMREQEEKKHIEEGL